MKQDIKRDLSQFWRYLLTYLALYGLFFACALPIGLLTFHSKYLFYSICIIGVIFTFPVLFVGVQRETVRAMEGYTVRVSGLFTFFRKGYYKNALIMNGLLFLPPMILTIAVFILLKTTPVHISVSFFSAIYAGFCIPMSYSLAATPRHWRNVFSDGFALARSKPLPLIGVSLVTTIGSLAVQTVLSDLITQATALVYDYFRPTEQFFAIILSTLALSLLSGLIKTFLTVLSTTLRFAVVRQINRTVPLLPDLYSSNHETPPASTRQCIGYYQKEPSKSGKPRYKRK